VEKETATAGKAGETGVTITLPFPSRERGETARRRR
jgi:hypothetical protein